MKNLFWLVGVVCLLVATPALYAQNPDYVIEPVVIKAQFPVAMAFTPDGRLFYTEKENGRVRMVGTDGILQTEPVISLPSDPNVELGMLGIAVDPNFAENHYIWITHIQPNTVEPPYPIWKLVRFTEENGVGSDPVTMLEVPLVTREQHHVGGNVHFDDAGYLYVSIGDMGNPAFSQDLTAMQGKIHRFQVEGDTLIPAPDNPFPDSSVYAYGLRNPFDFDFDPISGEIITGENGPQCDDEINLVYPAGNYGWRPDYPCDDNAPQEAARYIYPLIYFTPPEGVTGVLVYDGEMFPEWEGDVFFCGWNQGLMRRMELNPSRERMTSVEILRFTSHSCSTDVEVAPDGSIYFTNFNSIYRLVAP